MRDISISLFAETNIGMRRSINEDSCLIADLEAGNSETPSQLLTHPIGEHGYLMVVSDGMGGAAAGEVASDFAVKTMLEKLLKLTTERSIAEQLREAAEAANQRIWNHAEENPELSGMGATLTAIIAYDGKAHIAQVGDSRAYLVRQGAIEQLTKDQSLVQALLDSGMVQPDQAHLIPQNVILQALGTQPSVNAVMTEFELCRNDAMVMCSDGLSNKIKPEEMVDIISNAPSLEAAGSTMIALANERGGEDNITVIISKFDGEGLSEKAEGKRVSGNFNAFDKNISYEEAQYIANRYVPQTPGEEEADAGGLDTSSTGILKMPTGFGAAPKVEEVAAEPPSLPVDDAETIAAREAIAQKHNASERRTMMVMWVIAIVSLLLLAVVGYLMLK
jgi:serine/threonine protein phosphatase PrpC